MDRIRENIKTYSFAKKVVERIQFLKNDPNYEPSIDEVREWSRIMRYAREIGLDPMSADAQEILDEISKTLGTKPLSDFDEADTEVDKVKRSLNLNSDTPISQILETKEREIVLRRQAASYLNQKNEEPNSESIERRAKIMGINNTLFQYGLIDEERSQLPEAELVRKISNVFGFPNSNDRIEELYRSFDSLKRKLKLPSSANIEDLMSKKYEEIQTRLIAVKKLKEETKSAQIDDEEKITARAEIVKLATLVGLDPWTSPELVRKEQAAILGLPDTYDEKQIKDAVEVMRKTLKIPPDEVYTNRFLDKCKDYININGTSLFDDINTARERVAATKTHVNEEQIQRELRKMNWCRVLGIGDNSNESQIIETLVKFFGITSDEITNARTAEIAIAQRIESLGLSPDASPQEIANAQIREDFTKEFESIHANNDEAYYQKLPSLFDEVMSQKNLASKPLEERRKLIRTKVEDVEIKSIAKELGLPETADRILVFKKIQETLFTGRIRNYDEMQYILSDIKKELGVNPNTKIDDILSQKEDALKIREKAYSYFDDEDNVSYASINNKVQTIELNNELGIGEDSSIQQAYDKLSQETGIELAKKQKSDKISGIVEFQDSLQSYKLINGLPLNARLVDVAKKAKELKELGVKGVDKRRLEFINTLREAHKKVYGYEAINEGELFARLAAVGLNPGTLEAMTPEGAIDTVYETLKKKIGSGTGILENTITVPKVHPKERGAGWKPTRLRNGKINKTLNQAALLDIRDQLGEMLKETGEKAPTKLSDAAKRLAELRIAEKLGIYGVSNVKTPKFDSKGKPILNADGTPQVDEKKVPVSPEQVNQRLQNLGFRKPNPARNMSEVDRRQAEYLRLVSALPMGKKDIPETLKIKEKLAENEKQLEARRESIQNQFYETQKKLNDELANGKIHENDYEVEVNHLNEKLKTEFSDIDSAIKDTRQKAEMSIKGIKESEFKKAPFSPRAIRKDLRDNLGFNRFGRTRYRSIPVEKINQRVEAMQYTGEFDQMTKMHHFPDKRPILNKLGDQVRKFYKPKLSIANSTKKITVMHKLGAKDYVEKYKSSAELFKRVGFTPKNKGEFFSNYYINKAKRLERDIRETPTFGMDPKVNTKRELRNAQYDKWAGEREKIKPLVDNRIAKGINRVKNRLFTSNEKIEEMKVERRWKTTKKVFSPITKSVSYVYKKFIDPGIKYARGTIMGLYKYAKDVFNVLQNDGKVSEKK